MIGSPKPSTQSADLAVAKPRIVAPDASLFQFWLPLRTRNRDTDQFGHVNHAAMATLLEEARVALIFCPDLMAETQSVDLLVASLFMTFHKELRAPGEVRLGASITRIGTSSFDIRQAIFANDDCHTSAVATCVLLNSKARTPARVGEGMRMYLMSAQN